MAERSETSTEMMWAFAWWLAALVAAVLVFFVMSMLIPDDPAAGLVFGGTTFVIVGLVMVYFGPGPAADGAVAAYHAPAVAHDVTATAPVVPVAPAVSEPQPAGPVPGVGISERVRDAARAAGEAARAALGDEVPASEPVQLMVERPPALEAPTDGSADDLKKIKGIGPKLETLLHSLGIFHFGQIAGWRASEIAWMDSHLEGFVGRVTRDDWVGQAKLLATGAETEFSQRVDKGEVY